jgi:hypothetical protein
MTYKIIGTHQFYGPRTQRIEVDGIVEHRDGYDRRINVFATRKAAQAYINELENERYYLMHNESERPTYRIKKLREAR